MLNHQQAEAVFQALGDSTRRAIITQLTAGPASVSELAAPLNISRSAVLQHLDVLEKTRLVVSRKQGRVRTCELDPEGLAIAAGWLDQHRRRWEQRLDRLATVLNGD